MSNIQGEELRFEQENGPEVGLTVFGDEFYARYENEEGYSVVYDVDLGLYCYAQVVRGEFVSSGVPITKVPPGGTRRHLRESGGVRSRKFRTRYSMTVPPRPPGPPVPTMRVYGADKGLLPGRKHLSGEVVGLTVMVQFQDFKCSQNREQVAAMLNDKDYSADGNACSAREYFLRVSGGRLDYRNEVYGPVTLPKRRGYYAYARENLLVREVLRELERQNVDFSRFDSTGSGRIDAINVMYAGLTDYRGWLWPHNFVIDMSIGGMRTEYYQICSLGSSSIGTFCHENGHMLCRFPDLYDYGDPERDGDAQDSSGLGGYCLMSSGNHLDHGRTPSPVCAYLRDLAGWVTNKVSINRPGKFMAEHGDYATAFMFALGPRHENEYFLVESRFANGLDGHLPSSGLAVYHCDIEGSNEYQDGTPSRHYQCALLQADGRRDLERNANSGDSQDLFSDKEGVALSYDTNPSSRRWDRSDSGLVMKNIGPPGDRITFETE